MSVTVCWCSTMASASPKGHRRKSSAIPRSSKPISGCRMLLEVRGLEVSYGGIRAVKGIDLEVGEGELVCLIGANGAGKSTTLRTICGLLAPRAGSVRYAGEDALALPPHELPRRRPVRVPEGPGV